MTKDEGNKTFVRITNKMIYDEIVETKEHVKCTNGKVAFNRKSIYAMGLVLLTLAGWIFTHVNGG